MTGSPRWLTRDRLERMLARLAGEGALVAPVEVEGEVLFLPVDDPAEMTRDYVNSHVPPKELFLPARDRLLAYRTSGGVATLEPDEDAPCPERVVFGMRSCDVAGLAYLERWFSGRLFDRPDTADAPFMRRREATTVISVTCRTPGPTCMCVCCEGGPALERGYDWQLGELDEGWLVEVGSERGERLAERFSDLLGTPPAGAPEAHAQRLAATRDHFGEHSAHRVPTMAATRMVSAGLLGDAFWRIVGDRCFECGGCAHVCPTCWCFNVADVPVAGGAELDGYGDEVVPMVPGGATDTTPDGRWERVRMRDCCMLAGFVRQAGGGYPRHTCGERCVTRFFHKLSQQYFERMDAPGCTGCGRCISACLGEEGIDAVAEGMRVVLTGPGRASTAPARIIAGAAAPPATTPSPHAAAGHAAGRGAAAVRAPDAPAPAPPRGGGRT